MKLLCSNCKKTLTKDLYPTKDYSYKHKDRSSYQQRMESVPIGSFMEDKSRWYDGARTLNVNQASVVTEIPKYKSGYGCCHYDSGDLLCSCGNVVAEMSLDCWMVPQIEFNVKKVIRTHSRLARFKVRSYNKKEQ